MAGIASTIQSLLKARLEGTGTFFDTNNIVVMTQNEPDTPSKVESMLDGITSGTDTGNGICVVVGMPSIQRDIPGRVSFSTIIEVIENTNLNRTSSGSGKYAEEVSEQVWSLLELWQSATETLTPFQPISLNQVWSFQGSEIWEIEVRTTSGIKFS